MSRPPVLLALGSLAVLAYAVDGVMHEGLRGGRPRADALLDAAVSVPLAMVAIPVAVFLAARVAASWLLPRLRIYRQLAEYLRVMWIPIGGFAVGYLAIIVVFAGIQRHAGPLSPRGVRGARTTPASASGSPSRSFGRWPRTIRASSRFRPRRGWSSASR